MSQEANKLGHLSIHATSPFSPRARHVVRNARRDMVADEDRKQSQDRLAAQVARSQWYLIGVVLVHLGKEELEA